MQYLTFNLNYSFGQAFKIANLEKHILNLFKKTKCTKYMNKKLEREVTQ
jgi:hypothetical protein